MIQSMMMITKKRLFNNWFWQISDMHLPTQPSLKRPFIDQKLIAFLNL